MIPYINMRNLNVPNVGIRGVRDVNVRMSSLRKLNIPETGNQIRRRKGQEMRAGTRPYPKYPSKESRIADTSGMFDENGQYIYPPKSGFNWMEKIDPNSPWNCTGGKVS